MSERRTILAIDDTPENLRLVEALLVPQGYDVITASSGRKALADLAKCDKGVGWVVAASKVRKGPARKLAREVLAGEMGSLAALAEALSDASHPLAERIKELTTPPRKKGRKKR